MDGMINKLLEVRGKKPGKNVQLSEDDIKYLCTKSRELFIAQPNLLELEAPIKICGKSSCINAISRSQATGLGETTCLEQRGKIYLADITHKV